MTTLNQDGTKEHVWQYWKDRQKDEPDFWKDRGEWNLSEMIDMALETFALFDIAEDVMEDYAYEYINVN